MLAALHAGDHIRVYDFEEERWEIRKRAFKESFDKSIIPSDLAKITRESVCVDKRYLHFKSVFIRQINDIYRSSSSSRLDFACAFSRSIRFRCATLYCKERITMSTGYMVFRPILRFDVQHRFFVTPLSVINCKCVIAEQHVRLDFNPRGKRFNRSR